VQGLAAYILRRLLWVPVILVLVSMVTFALGRYAPSDYVRLQAGPRANPETIERIREERGLNDPVYEQYTRWLGNAVQGDFGESTRYRGVAISDILFDRIWVTVQYNIVILTLVFMLGIPVGTFCAVKRGTWIDPATMAVFLVMASVPVVVAIPIIQWIFTVKLGILPTSGWQTRNILGVETGLFSTEAIMPITLLTLIGVAGVARYMRSQVIEVLDQDYVRTARAKGLEEVVVVSRHVIRNALLPIVTIMGFALAGLVAGSIIIETLLGIPGAGRFAFESVGARDYDAIMAIVLLGSLLFMLGNLIADIAYAFIDPRIRMSGQAGG
jgi:ABC-type dipeptide/oligopeptide/nickel transport system permease component